MVLETVALISRPFTSSSASTAPTTRRRSTWSAKSSTRCIRRGNTQPGHLQWRENAGDRPSNRFSNSLLDWW